MTCRLAPLAGHGEVCVQPQSGVSHPKLAKGNDQPSYAKATEGILPSLRERRMVGGEGIEPPTLSV